MKLRTMTLDIECCYAECHDFFIIMLNVVMPSVVMLNVVAPYPISLHQRIQQGIQKPSFNQDRNSGALTEKG
jgi:hypothetical protein